MDAERAQAESLLRRLVAEQIAMADELRREAEARGLPGPSLDETVAEYCARLERLHNQGSA